MNRCRRHGYYGELQYDMSVRYLGNEMNTLKIGTNMKVRGGLLDLIANVYVES